MQPGVEQHTFIRTMNSPYAADVQQRLSSCATTTGDLGLAFTAGTDLSALVQRLVRQHQGVAASALVAAIDELVGRGLLELEMRDQLVQSAHKAVPTS